MLSTARSINKPRLILGMNPRALGALIGLAALAVFLSDGIPIKVLVAGLLVGGLWLSKRMQSKDPKWIEILHLRRYQGSIYDPFRRAPFKVQRVRNR